MGRNQFRRLVEPLAQLTAKQKETLRQLLEPAEQPDESAAAVAETGRPTCPRCGGDACRWGRRDGMQRYCCRRCRKTFNPLTGTPLARLGGRPAWLGYAEALRDGLSVRKAAKKLGVHHTPIFRWRHRWLTHPCQTKDTTFTGIVETDETFFLRSLKGSRAWVHPGPDTPSREPRKRGGKAARPGLSSEQVPVLVVRDRNAATTDSILPALDLPTIQTVLDPLMNPKGGLHPANADPI
jgi:transposase-like protein